MAVHVDITDLRLLVAIAKAGSQSEGASKAAISAGAASQRIRNLEEGFGLKLLHHEPGVPAKPTRAGQRFISHARKLLNQHEAMMEEMMSFAHGLAGEVKLLSNTNALIEFLPDALGAFLRANPRVTVDLEERPSDDIVRLVAEGEGDIGIVAGVGEPEGLASFPFRSDRLCLVVAKEHELAGRKAVEFIDIAHCDFVGYDRSSPLQRFIESKAAALGHPIHVRVRLRGFDAVCRLIDKNVGVSVVPFTAARRCARTLAISLVDLADDWATRDLKIVCRAEALRPSAQHLLDHLRAV